MHRSWLGHLRDSLLPGDSLVEFGRWIWAGFQRSFALAFSIIALTGGYIVGGIIILLVWFSVEAAFVTYFYKSEKRLLEEWELYGDIGE